MKYIAKIFLLFIILISCFSFFVCDNGLRQGYVIKKEFKAENIVEFTTFTYVLSGTVIVPIPLVWSYHYPDRWLITIQNKDKENIFYVDEETYNLVSIGVWFDGSFFSTVEPCSKIKKGD